MFRKTCPAICLRTAAFTLQTEVVSVFLRHGVMLCDVTEHLQRFRGIDIKKLISVFGLHCADKLPVTAYYYISAAVGGQCQQLWKHRFWKKDRAARGTVFGKTVYTVGIQAESFDQSVDTV